MNLGNKIAKIRKDNKMSQEDFAEIFNVTRQTISSWENSKSYPDIESLIKLSDKFNISLDILLKENMDMVKDIDKKVKDNRKLKRIIILIIILILFIGLCIASIKIVDDKQTISLESKTIDKVKDSLNRWYGDNPIFYTDKNLNSKNLDLKDSLIKALYLSLEHHNNIKMDNEDSLEFQNRKICEINEDTDVLSFDTQKNKCIYSTATKKDINKTYNLLFGIDVPKFIDVFDKTNCVLASNEKYYCAKKREDNSNIEEKEDINIITVKAKKRFNDDIDIYQYYLRIKNNKCYSSSLDIENTTCTKELIESNMDKMSFDERYDFKNKIIKKYGTYYKITVILNKELESYFWRETKIIK